MTCNLLGVAAIVAEGKNQTNFKAEVCFCAFCELQKEKKIKRIRLARSLLAGKVTSISVSARWYNVKSRGSIPSPLNSPNQTKIDDDRLLAVVAGRYVIDIRFGQELPLTVWIQLCWLPPERWWTAFGIVSLFRSSWEMVALCMIAAKRRWR